MSTLQFIQEENLVEIRYEGVNATLLAALAADLVALEAAVAAGGGSTGIAIAALEADIAALQLQMTAVTSGLADEIARATAAEDVLTGTIADTFADVQSDITDAVAAEAIIRLTADNAEVVARDAAIAAAVDPLGDLIDTLETNVGVLSSAVTAAQDDVAALTVDLAAETAARIAGDATNSSDIGNLGDALLDEVAAREAFQATLGGATYLTVDDETADFVNSRQMLAGTNITFDDTVAGKRTINASGGGGGGAYYLFPLSNGDPDSPEIIFDDDGEIVSVAQVTFS